MLPALLLAAAALVTPAFGRNCADLPEGVEFPSSETALEKIRATGALDQQRYHLWTLFSAITRTSGACPLSVFLTWYGAGEVFAEPSAVSAPGVRGLAESFSLPPPKSRLRTEVGAAPLIVRAHYNFAAYSHVRSNGLEQAARLLATAHDRSVPAFPRDAMIVKTVWWPVPARGVVALPVWDSAENPPRNTGNSYLTWSRVVAVSARAGFGVGRDADVEFLGRSFKHAHAVGIDALYHVTLDRRMAESLMSDPEARKLAALVLGRPLRAKDMVALVAMHLATREVTDWVWGTFWWHDRPEQGADAAPLQPVAAPPGRNYSMSVAFDAELPRESDGSPHVAFNPWLEGRFPDGGHGAGIVSNCMSCHRRASTALDQPFLVTRGGTGSQASAVPGEPAIATSSLWSLALQAR